MQGKSGKSDEISFSISPEEDSAYMDAVEKGDMAIAERMVKDAAKRAMPHTKVVDGNGEPLVVYHGTPNDNLFYTFVRGERKSSNPLASTGFWFAESVNFVKSFVVNSVKNRMKYGMRDVDAVGVRVVSGYINMKNPKVFETPKDAKEIAGTSRLRDDAYDQFRYAVAIYQYDVLKIKGQQITECSVEKYVEYLKSQGYDGIIT